MGEVLEKGEMERLPETPSRREADLGNCPDVRYLTPARVSEESASIDTTSSEEVSSLEGRVDEVKFRFLCSNWETNAPLLPVSIKVLIDAPQVDSEWL
ncbi:hypothetical protein CEXT_111141 [Caerostris extrusa]|uniref:Uncharacterized protein n=1 Tax=Caerostris extrusa TaxID=172846 RepID=A0AAV4MYL2_CAEEX|nr:hypothetical protein CEXT_111141 [Caerostris extrusa]